MLLAGAESIEENAGTVAQHQKRNQDCSLPLGAAGVPTDRIPMNPDAKGTCIMQSWKITSLGGEGRGSEGADGKYPAQSHFPGPHGSLVSELAVIYGTQLQFQSSAHCWECMFEQSLLFSIPTAEPDLLHFQDLAALIFPLLELTF